MSELKRAIEKPKNCPCCDSEDISVGSVVVSFGEDIFIKCNSCGIKLQICKEYGYRELLKRWNTRKPMDRIVERLEEEKSDWNDDYNVPIKKAIEIVKEEGGMNDNT